MTGSAAQGEGQLTLAYDLAKQIAGLIPKPQIPITEIATLLAKAIASQESTPLTAGNVVGILHNFAVDTDLDTAQQIANDVNAVIGRQESTPVRCTCFERADGIGPMNDKHDSQCPLAQESAPPAELDSDWIEGRYHPSQLKKLSRMEHHGVTWVPLNQVEELLDMVRQHSTPGMQPLTQEDLLQVLTRYEGAVQATERDGDDSDEAVKELEAARAGLIVLLQQAKLVLAHPPSEKLRELSKRWRNAAQLDRNKNAEMQERMNRGETVEVTCSTGPYIDPRETCADELEAALEPPHAIK